MTFCKLLFFYELIRLKLKWPISFVGHFHSEIKKNENGFCQGYTNFLYVQETPLKITLLRRVI
jgi:hypothetical protein